MVEIIMMRDISTLFMNHKEASLIKAIIGVVLKIKITLKI